MRGQAQLSETIQRFHDSFWAKKATARPPVGVYDDRIFLPIGFLRRPFPRTRVLPEDLTEGLAMTEYEYSFKDRAVSCDDLLAFSAPWRAIPWLEACAGCPVRYSEGSLAPGHFVDSAEELADVPIPAGNGWLECMQRQTAWLTSQVQPDCWISPSILRGPSDILAAMRGITNFLMDLLDHPQAVRAAAGRVNRMLLDALDAHFSMVKPRLGGYSHIFGYWAPAKTIAIQEDTMGMASPASYRDIFMEHNAEVVRRLGEHVLFHLHATGYKHYRDVLNIPGIAGLQIVMETGGPTLLDLLPVFREILEKSRLILQVGDCVEHLPEVLRKLPREGLFLTISNRQIRSDQEFRQFISAHWNC
jgi:hypothetical protein